MMSPQKNGYRSSHLSAMNSLDDSSRRTGVTCWITAAYVWVIVTFL